MYGLVVTGASEYRDPSSLAGVFAVLGIQLSAERMYSEVSWLCLIASD